MNLFSLLASFFPKIKKKNLKTFNGHQRYTVTEQMLDYVDW